MTDSYRRTNEGTAQEVEPSTAGASGGGDHGHESVVTWVSPSVFDDLIQWLDEPPGQPPPWERRENGNGVISAQT